MSFTIPRFRGALFTLLALLAAGCTTRDNNTTTVIPQGPPASTLATVSGTLVGVGGAPPKVSIKVFSTGLTELTAFETTSLASGRWSVSGLPAGTYRFRLFPPTPDPNDATTNLRSVSVSNVVVGADDVVVPPVIFAPVENGGLLIRTSDPADQFLRFREDPRNLSSPLIPGLESMEFMVRANTVLKLFGFTLTQLGLDDDTTSPTTRELLVEIAIIRADQLPAAHIDENGASRTSQVYYVLYPEGIDFSTTSTVTRELEIDFPNVNGLSGVFETPQLAFSFLSNSWNPAGVVDVSSDGLLVRADSFDGPKQTGIVVAPGPPTPTTTATGQVTSGGNPLLRAGISVITNSGFSGLTDVAGVYRIENVPIPLNRADLVVTAFTDAGLKFAMASNVARPTYPSTTIDIELAALPLTTPNCVLANSEPITGSVGNHTNERIRIRFDDVMDRDSLQTAISVVATPDVGTASAITGTVVTNRVDVGAGVFHTDAFFLADVPLPVTATIAVAVSTSATNAEGVALGVACSFSFRTGTSTLFLPRIDAMEPQSGAVGTSVTIYGSNLDIASVSFDGSNLAVSSKASGKLTFNVPTSEGDEAPGARVVSIAPGTEMANFDILPRIDSIQFDDDPDPGIENLVNIGAGAPGTSIAGVDQNDGTLIVINGQNLFDPAGGLMPLVTFGRGDGVVAGSTDGDADIDGPDETAAEERIDVNVPPQATSASLTVTVDDGAGSTFRSLPFTFVIDLPSDSVSPVFDGPSFVPAAGATGVSSTTVIRVPYNEAISGDSRLLVAAGSPARQLPGSTRVTTSLDGTQGFLEFLPSAGSLPLSSTIQVQLSNAFIFDLAGNPSSSFDYSFMTGTTEPTGGALPDPTDDDIAVLPVEPIPAEVRASKTQTSLDSASQVVLQALELGASQSEAGIGSGEEKERVSGIAELLFDSRISVQDESVADWGDRAPVARWPVENSTDAAVRGLYVADNWGYDADGSPLVESFFRFELIGRKPDPERHAFRFRLSMADGETRLTGVITDLNHDGSYELSLFSDGETGLSALAREDLVQVGDGFLEIKFPAHAPISAYDEARKMSFFSVQSFDMQASTYVNSPVVQFEY